jgi:hypothetical protein
MEDVLVLERTGTRWGVQRPLVRAYDRGREGIRITLDSGCLGADRVVGMATGVEVRLPGRVLARFWPVSTRGLVVHEGRVVVVIDPAKPPDVLAYVREGDAHEG